MTTTENGQRDELAELIANTKYPNLAPAWRLRGDLNPVKFFSRKQADAVLSAGYRKSRTITTVEELDALPEGSVILDECGPVERYTSALSGKRGWYVGGNQSTPILPAIVLWGPEAEVRA